MESIYADHVAPPLARSQVSGSSQPRLAPWFAVIHPPPCSSGSRGRSRMLATASGSDQGALNRMDAPMEVDHPHIP